MITKHNIFKTEFEDGEVATLPVKFILKHLNSLDKKKVESNMGDSWVQKQSEAYGIVLDAIDEGNEPGDFDPIRLVLNHNNMFSVAEGVNLLRAFRKRKVKMIQVELHHRVH